MPPKHDSRDGKASADSFAISRSTFVASMNRSVFAVKSHEFADAIMIRPHT